MATKAEMIEVMEAAATLMAAKTNRFGKPEFYSAEEMAAREVIRERAVRYQVPMSYCGTVLNQTAGVIRAVLEQ